MGFKALLAYKKSSDLVMTIFNIAKSFPDEERYAFTGQTIRSSRLSVQQLQKLTEKDNMKSIF